jgi:type II secretory pathway pseudopilin PulG
MSISWARSSSSEAGFSIAETLIAIGILGAVAMGVAQLFAASTMSNVNAKLQTSATVLATQKMEQLRGLTWGFDTIGLGLPLSDTTSNLATDPIAAGGHGLNPSPAGTLDGNVAGYFDYLGSDGGWLGTGDPPPAGAVYLRRWAVDPLPTNPNNTLILQVVVTSVARERTRDVTQPKRRMPGDAWLVSVKTRKAS